MNDDRSAGGSNRVLFYYFYYHLDSNVHNDDVTPSGRARPRGRTTTVGSVLATLRRLRAGG